LQEVVAELVVDLGEALLDVCDLRRGDAQRDVGRGRHDVVERGVGAADQLGLPFARACGCRVGHHLGLCPHQQRGVLGQLVAAMPPEPLREPVAHTRRLIAVEVHVAIEPPVGQIGCRAVADAQRTASRDEREHAAHRRDNPAAKTWL